jgi:hypothetical protein
MVFSFFLGNYLYGFNIKNLEFFHILTCLFSFFYLAQHYRELSIKAILWIGLGCVALFSFTFIGMDSGHIGSRMDAEVSLDQIEYLRSYHQGLFRIPHIASYFFSFLALFAFYLWTKNGGLLPLLLSLLLFAAVLYVGVRTTLFAMALSVGLYYFRLRYLFFLIPLSLAAVSVLWNLDYFLEATKGSFLFQYFSILYTLSNNLESLSRIQIWMSWWTEVQQFNLLDFLIGKSFYNSMVANMKNLDYNIWFHNDHLSIFYAYGVVSWLAYISVFAFIYFKFRHLLQRNLILFIMFSSMVLSSFFNGFYYYITFLLIYIFFYVVKRETAHFENRHSGLPRYS